MNEEKAREFDNEHPEIWVQFVKVAKTAKAKGFKTWSADAIFQIIRWESDVTKFEEYKVNNNYRKYYAKKLVTTFPEFEGFFKFRN